MTIDKAIEILQDLPVGGQQISLEDRLDATKLGIVALKREQSYREYELKGKWYPLPGETKIKE